MSIETWLSLVLAFVGLLGGILEKNRKANQGKKPFVLPEDWDDDDFQKEDVVSRPIDTLYRKESAISQEGERVTAQEPQMPSANNLLHQVEEKKFCDVAEEFDARRAVLESEILKPKFDDGIC